VLQQKDCGVGQSLTISPIYSARTKAGGIEQHVDGRVRFDRQSNPSLNANDSTRSPRQAMQAVIRWA
jgi:hypothetical protein